jgi:hypothetical protein
MSKYEGMDMVYTLSVAKTHYELIHDYFAEPDMGKRVAFLLTQIDSASNSCQINTTDFIAIDEHGSSRLAASVFGIQPPILMETIDKAMESCKSLLFLYSEPGVHDDGFNPAQSSSNRIVFRIAYHFLPFGQHACLAYDNSRLYGRAWLNDSTTEPMNIRIS